MFETPGDATPLDPDETEGLLAGDTTSHSELNELEEANIQLGLEWAVNSAVYARRRVDVLSEEFVFEVHRLGEPIF